VLSEKLTQADRDCVNGTKALVTICDGEVVFSRQ
jgi:hypothetical protein